MTLLERAPGAVEAGEELAPSSSAEPGDDDGQLATTGLGMVLHDLVEGADGAVDGGARTTSTNDQDGVYVVSRDGNASAWAAVEPVHAMTRPYTHGFGRRFS